MDRPQGASDVTSKAAQRAVVFVTILNGGELCGPAPPSLTNSSVFTDKAHLSDIVSFSRSSVFSTFSLFSQIMSNSQPKLNQRS